MSTSAILFVPEGVFSVHIYRHRQDVLWSMINMAEQMLLEGKTLIKWTGQGDEAQHQIVTHPMKLLIEAQYCLQQIDPCKYGHLIDNSKAVFI
jgi:hypothetical protein